MSENKEAIDIPNTLSGIPSVSVESFMRKNVSSVGSSMSDHNSVDVSVSPTVLYTYSTNADFETENDIEFQIGRAENSCTVQIHSATYKGSVREHMEDAVLYTVLKYKNWIIILSMLMDGHAGFSVVSYCTSHFVKKFTEILPKFIGRGRFKSKSVARIMKQILDICTLHCHNSTKEMDSGTTLSALCMVFNTLPGESIEPVVVSANVGDSPVYGIHYNGTMRATKLSVDHSANSSKRERRRLEESKSLQIEDDGYIERDGNSIAMTRSIGDHVFGDEITAKPYVRHVKKRYDVYTMYSDGVSDVMKIGYVMNQIRLGEISSTDHVNVSKSVLDHRNSIYEQHDNTSMIYIRLIRSQ